MAAALAARHEELLELRQDSKARRVWLDETGRAPFMSCPACRQSTRPPICTWCDHELPAAVYEDVARPGLSGVRLQGHRVYSLARGVFRLDVVEQLRLIVHLLRWVLLGAVVGAVDCRPPGDRNEGP